ncbi:MAG: hypothetical protein Q9167_002384 [Letrouitia subvulpina]
MVESMDHSFAFHRHTRSMSSLASTIIPMTSDISAYTSVTASPMDSQASIEPPIEAKLPLTQSGACATPKEEARPPLGTDLPSSDNVTEIEVPADNVRIQGPGDRKNSSTALDELALAQRDEIDERAIAEEPLQVSPVLESATEAVSAASDAHFLHGLRRVMDLEAYHRRNTQALRLDLERLKLSHGLKQRFLSSSAFSYPILVGRYRDGDAPGFADLFEAHEQLLIRCNSIRAGLSEATDVFQSLNGSGDIILPWTEKLPSDYRQYILDFLHRIRSDDGFLADRLLTLSSLQLAALVSSRKFSPNFGSLFRGQNKSNARQANEMLGSGADFPALSSLRQLHQGDPFYVLLHGVFNTSAKPGSREYTQRTIIWANACAKMFSENRGGTEELTVAVLDALTETSDWTMKPKLEAFIMRTLRNGAFLVDPNSRQSRGSKAPIEIRNADAAIAGSKFFDESLRELFSLLAEDPADSYVPKSACDFIQAVLKQIPDAILRNRTRNFIVSRWFYLSKTTAIVSPDIRASIGHLLTLVNPKHENLPPSYKSSFENGDITAGCLMLSAHDIFGLIQALFPSNVNSASSASSILDSKPSTGSSTLTNSSQDAKTSISTTPSTSATSLASTLKAGRDFLSDVKTQPNEKQPELPATKTENRHFASDINDLRSRLDAVQHMLMSMHESDANRVNEAVSSSHNWAFFDIQTSGRVMLPDPYMGQQIAQEPAIFGAKEDQDLSRSRLLRSAVVDLIIGPYFEPFVHAGLNGTSASMLGDLLDTATMHAQSAYDFSSAHRWWQSHLLLRQLLSSEHGRGLYNRILQSIMNQTHNSIDSLVATSEFLKKRMHLPACQQVLQKAQLLSSAKQRRALRLRMWYNLDVRHSSTYENALYVVNALKAMANRSRSKQYGNLTNWARQRVRNPASQDQSLIQTIEALSERDGHGGQSKLNDEQVERTTRWLTRNSIENFCKGEERIHRFCYEIKKCISKLAGPTMLETPVLWSSKLFERERMAFDTKSSVSRSAAVGMPPASLVNATALSSLAAPLSSTISNFTKEYPPEPYNDSVFRLASKSSLPSQGFGGETLGREPIRKRSSTQESSTTWYQDSSRAIFAPSIAWNENHIDPARHQNEAIVVGQTVSKGNFISEIKRDLCGLLLSDLGYLSWQMGTETDVWMNQSLGEDASQVPQAPMRITPVEGEPGRQQTIANGLHSTLALLKSSAHTVLQDKSSRWRSNIPDHVPNTAEDDSTKLNIEHGCAFPYSNAYATILERFTLSADPYFKLEMLLELELMAAKSIEDSQQFYGSMGSSSVSFPKKTATHSNLGSRSLGVPRTKATRFEEVVANCTERRASTMQSYSFGAAPPADIQFIGHENFGTDDIIDCFLRIFRNNNLRPRALFRDLQYIASFVPAEILDHTVQGKAFWDAGLAALALKEDVCNELIERATQITNYHISADKSYSSHSTSATAPSAQLKETSLGDAAQLWIIAAKEGSAVAARELALFYLTHPELLPRVVMPFAKPTDVFGSAGFAEGGGAGTGRGEQGGRLDLETFRVVVHWMEEAANGSDKVARDFLKGMGELKGK